MSALWRMDNYLCNAKLETKEEKEGCLDDGQTRRCEGVSGCEVPTAFM